MFSVKISYKMCIEKTLEDSLVYVPSIVSQAEPTPVQGICGKNSKQIVNGNLTVLCDGDGEWNTSRLESRCVCKEGMENRGGVCTGMEDITCKGFFFISPLFLDGRQTLKTSNNKSLD